MATDGWGRPLAIVRGTILDYYNKFKSSHFQPLGRAFI